MRRQLLTRTNIALALLVVLLIVLPSLTPAFFINFVMTQTMLLGLARLSLAPTTATERAWKNGVSGGRVTGGSRWASTGVPPPRAR